MVDIYFLDDYSNTVNNWLFNYFKSKKEPFVVYGLINEFLSLGGKRFRPALTMITTEMFGYPRDISIKPACAIELFHNFTLIHDDIEDNSELRRGRPCLHKKYGLPLAINAGDGLFILVFDILSSLEFSPKKTLAIQKNLIASYMCVLEGQGIELSWINDNKWNISEHDYFKMVYGKTASLIEGALVVGGLISNTDKKTLSYLAEFGRLIGTGFQIQDDYLNIVGEESKYKKEIGGDISEGKRTLMTIHAMNNLPKAKSERLKTILSMHTKDQTLISEAINLLKQAKSPDYAIYKARQCVTKAIEIAKTKFPDNEHRDKLIEIAKFLVCRDF